MAAFTAPNLPDRFPMDMQVAPNDEATVYITYSGFGSGHLFRTTDYGDSWEDLSAGLPDVPTNAVVLDPAFPGFIYVGNDLGVFVSTDDGLNWHPFQEGLPGATMVFDLTIASVNRKLRVATHGNGAYQRDLLEEEILGLEEASVDALANSIRLFPNPMQATATLQYELDRKERVVVQLLDAEGRLVRTLSDGSPVRGIQELGVYRQGLSAGIYFLRLQAGGKQVTRKLIVR